MIFKKSPDKFWNLLAPKYAASPIFDQAAYQTKIEKIKTYLAPESIVLDIGCGTGTQCGDLADVVKQVTGLDFSSKLLAIAEQRQAQRKQKNIEFVCASFFDQRFQSLSFDLVMAFYILHFFEDIDAVFTRIKELLKPGGVFVFEAACMGENNIIMGKILRFAGHLGLLPKMNLLTTAYLEEALQRTGFNLVEKIRFSQSSKEYTFFAKPS